MNRIKLHVRKGDNVEVISGNFKGSSGKVLEVIARKAARADRRRADDQKAPEEIAGQSAGENRGARRSDSHLECEGAGARRTHGQRQRRRQSGKRKAAKKKATKEKRNRPVKNEFYDHYKERVMPALQKQHGYKNLAPGPEGGEGRDQYFASARSRT